jgi:outer membrane protein
MKNLVKVAIVVTGLYLSGGTASAQQKFAHINSAELLQSMPEVKTADAAMEKFGKEKESQIQAMNSEYEKKGVAFTDKQKTLSEANKEALTKELQTMYAELQDLEKRIGEAQEKAQQDMEAKRVEFFNPILKKATDAVNAVAKEKAYAYVFDISQPTMIYFGGGDDILSLVKTKLGITATVPAASK